MFGTSYAGNRAIQRRRDEENRYVDMRRNVEAEQHAKQLAGWEQKTEGLIRKNMISNISLNLQNQAKVTLEERRGRLARMLRDEDEQYRRELDNLQETSVEKAQRMVKYAKELKANREEQRKQFAQGQLERQWRLACDDLRDLEGAAFRRYCLDKVQEQRVEKVNQRLNERDEEERWAAAWEAERMKKVERDAAEIRERKAFNYETKMDLMEQMQQKRADEVNRLKDQEEERKAFRLKLENDEREAIAEKKRRAQAKKEQMDRIQADNQMQMNAKAEQGRLTREQDLKDLEQVMEEHKADLAARADEKKKMREDMMKYRKYLEERKVHEAEIERQLEQLCQEEMERANAKRDMQWMREKSAREKLMKNVYEGRYEQIKQKEEDAYKREMEIYYDRQTMDREIAAAMKAEEEEDRKMKEDQVIRRNQLNRQKEYNQNRRQLEDAQKFREEEMSVQAERQYNAFLERERQMFEAKAYKPQVRGKRSVA